MKKITFILSFVLISISCLAQQNEQKDYIESPEDSYIFVPRETYTTTPAYQFSNSEITTIQVNVNESNENMVADAANEPSIAINPTNPDHMIIGWRQFASISSNFREAGYGYTLDGGETWSFPGPIEPGVFRSDPVLDVDLDGNFYYNSLKTGFTCDVFKSEPDNTWDSGTDAFGGDKQWMVIDKTGGATTGNIYALWKSAFSACPPHNFTRSLDGGSTYEDCSTLPDNMTRGTMAIGPNGELYICGGLGVQHAVAKSSNAGIEGENLEWDFSTVVDLGGQLSLYDGPNPTGMLGQVWIAVDHSGGDTHGNVYLLSTVRSNTTVDNADIVFSRSTDGGQTWSPPIKINDDNSTNNWQWFGTISVAPNGRIDVAWVDTRDASTGFNSTLYFSYSNDGGLTWSINEALSEPFDPLVGHPNQSKIGDYYHMISDEDGAHLAWSATFNGEQDVYYSYIQISEVTSNTILEQPESIRISPNPSQGFFNIESNIATDFSLTVYNMIGQALENIQIVPSQNFTLDMSNHPAGVYFVAFESEKGKVVHKIVKE